MSATEKGPDVQQQPDDWAASDARKPALLADLDEPLRTTVADRVVRVQVKDTPFLDGVRLWGAERTNRPGASVVNHPSFFYVAQLTGAVAAAPKARGLFTEADWEWLRTTARVRLDTAALRTAYVLTYVDVLRSQHVRYAWVAQKVEDLGLLVSADAGAMPRARSEAEAAKARALAQKYRDVVRPLTLAGDKAPWRGTFFANGRHHKIVRVDVILEADGRLTLTETVLEQDAPMTGVYP